MAERTPLHELTAQAGARFVEEAGWDVPRDFGDSVLEYSSARDGAALFDLSHRGKVELSGTEAATFLHNLCTNDITNLPLGAGCEFFLTNSKAKVVAHGYVFHVRLHDNRPAL